MREAENGVLDTPTYASLQADYRAFSRDRDWERFHDPKSLILALVGEVGELAELFQWIPAEEAQARFSSGTSRERAAEEMSDVLIYLTGLADVLGIDLLAAATDKLAKAAQRFPASTYQGVAPLKP